MELNKYDNIKRLDSSTYDWVCRLRLQSFWKGINREINEFWGFNMVFIDDSNGRIHAFASAKYCEELEKELIEGKIYILENFKVKDFLGDETYRPVRNRKHIYFTPHTKLTKDINEGVEIEEYAFDLFDMKEMEKLADDKRFLIDMVGKVENVQTPVLTTKNTEEKYRFKFDLSDGRFMVRVTLFDQFGLAIENKLKKYQNGDIFIIISCARPGRYEGSPNLTNYPATRVHINPEHYSVDILKERLGKMKIGGSLEIQEPIMKILTVKQIKNLPPNFSEPKVFCEVTVKKIDEKERWYYYKCTGCNTELFREQGKFRCTGDCKRLIPWPDKRFRLCTFCCDETGSIAIIFPDSEITRIIDQTVIDIHAECLTEIEEEIFPDALKIFLKQKYLVTLEIKEENVKKGSTVYEATELSEALEITDSFDPNHQEKMEIAVEKQALENDFMMEDKSNDTPNTGKSTNIKIRARKSYEPVTYEGNEPLLLKELKSIKKEKIEK